jgi:hypothetical protein
MWKWPLLFSSEWMDTIFTPICGVIVAGNKKHTDVFENQFCETTDINFFHGNRSMSSYNVDSGNRAYYGLKLTGYRNGENLYHFIVGRSTELISATNTAESCDLKSRNSNLVASLDVFLSGQWTLVSSASYSVRSKHWTKVEAGINFAGEEVSFDAMVFKGKHNFFNPFTTTGADLPEARKKQKYKGIAASANFCLTKAVRLKSGLVMGNDQNPVSAGSSSNGGHLRLVGYNVGGEYKNECVTVDFSIERRNYRCGDLKPETVFQFEVHLKNLGI